MRLSPLLLLFILTGCSTYNYDLVQPQSPHPRITADDWQHLTAGLLSYRFRAMENHLVVQIYNTTAEPIRLLGDRSYLVTPEKQSLPIPSQTIAPGSFAKLVLPPVEQPTHPYYYPPFDAGFGYYSSRADHTNLPEPTYLSDSPTPDWDWTGQTDVTLHLVFQQSDQKPLEQTFVFHRTKA